MAGAQRCEPVFCGLKKVLMQFAINENLVEVQAIKVKMNI